MTNRGLLYLERVMRFELTTASLATRGSTTELHPQYTAFNSLLGYCLNRLAILIISRVVSSIFLDLG